MGSMPKSPEQSHRPVDHPFRVFPDRFILQSTLVVLVVCLFLKTYFHHLSFRVSLFSRSLCISQFNRSQTRRTRVSINNTDCSMVPLLNLREISQSMVREENVSIVQLFEPSLLGPTNPIEHWGV